VLFLDEEDNDKSKFLMTEGESFAKLNNVTARFGNITSKNETYIEKEMKRIEKASFKGGNQTSRLGGGAHDRSRTIDWMGSNGTFGPIREHNESTVSPSKKPEKSQILNDIRRAKEKRVDV
jgi:hypothetical protein